MSVRNPIVCFSAVFICTVAPLFAQPDPQFARANQEFADGRFKDAINSYEEMVGSKKWSANLFYNLGNAYFRTNDFGRAILNYERALSLEPRHPEAEANLRLARDESRALELQQSWSERYWRMVTPDQYAMAAAVAFWITLFGVVSLVFSRRRSARLIALTIFAFLIFGLCLAGIYSAERGNNGRALAVVTASGVEARLATADNANSILALPAGSEVKIESQRGDWIYATLPNNLHGWITAKSVEQVRL